MRSVLVILVFFVVFMVIGVHLPRSLLLFSVLLVAPWALLLGLMRLIELLSADHVRTRRAGGGYDDVQTCPDRRCGRPNPPHARFCSHCGRPLSDVRPGVRA